MQLVEMGYFWRTTQLINFNISDKRVLDIGCGNGFYGPMYLLLGARLYAGADYKLATTSSLARDFRTWELKDIGVTPESLSRRFRGKIFLYRMDFEELKVAGAFDIVTMNLVTEHLMDIRGVFSKVHEYLATGGRFVFLHHNFYCWNGHHQKPQTVDEIDEALENQNQYLDWNHLRRQLEPDEYVVRKLNRVRLDELREVTEAFFDVQSWMERKSDTKRGFGRLTPQILASFPEYTERELLTQSVHCVAVKKE